MNPLKVISKNRLIRYALITLTVLVVLCILLRTHLFVVSGQSMEPTYGNYDFGIIWRHPKNIERHDVVLYDLNFRGYTSIGRIVALPGELIQYRDEKILVDNTVLDMSEYWITQPKAFGKLSRTLENDQYAIVGDNRHDAENVLLVTRDMIKGRFVYLPFIR